MTNFFGASTIGVREKNFCIAFVSEFRSIPVPPFPPCSSIPVDSRSSVHLFLYLYSCDGSSDLSHPHPTSPGAPPAVQVPALSGLRSLTRFKDAAAPRAEETKEEEEEKRGKRERKKRGRKSGRSPPSPSLPAGVTPS